MKFFDVKAKRMVDRIPDGDYTLQNHDGKIVFSRSTYVLYVCHIDELLVSMKRGGRQVFYQLEGKFNRVEISAVLENVAVARYGFDGDTVWFEGKPSPVLTVIHAQVCALVRE